MVYVHENSSAQKWLHYIRKQEVNKALEFFPNGKKLKILDLGGGDGYIASLLAERGYEVNSIDIDPRFPQHYYVQKVSDSKLPFPNATFDIIFSSNVLEHVKNLDDLFLELKRVSKKGVTMIHTMPTPAWRVTSSFWHYSLLGVTLIKILFNRVNKQRGRPHIVDIDNIEHTTVNVIKSSYISKLKNLILDPHGEYPSSIHEIWYFSKLRWRRVLLRNNFRIILICRAPLMYAGRDLFRFKFINLRKIMAKYLFSAVNIYVIKKG